jgi:hypothetical protein
VDVYDDRFTRTFDPYFLSLINWLWDLSGAQPTLPTHFSHHMVILSMHRFGGFYAHDGYAGR